MNLYQSGDLVRLTAVFRDLAGALVDPSTVILKVTKPAGTQNTYTYALAQVIKDSTGNYHYDVSVDATGLWRYTWSSTGSGQAAENGEFRVEAAQ